MMQFTLQKPSSELITILATVSLSLAGLLLIVRWFYIVPNVPLKIRKAPPPDELAQALAVQKINIKGTFTQFSGQPSASTESWSGFRGGAHDNVAVAGPSLRGTLPPENLPILWSQKLGEGYAGPAIRNGRVYVLDYDKEKQSDALRCFSLDTGEEIWRRAYRIPIKRNHGISRTVPAVTDQYAVTLGPKCQVMCVDAITGDYKWGLDLPAKYGTEVPLWYAGQCPLIQGDLAVLAPAGQALLIGVDLASGQVRWETPNPDKLNMSHSSVIPMTFLGKKMYVYCALGGMVGVAASGPDQGEVLWQTTEWNHSVISPSPVAVPGNRILVTAGYGGGSRMFQVSKNQGRFEVRSLKQWDKETFACEQHTPIYYQGHLYTVLPNDAGEHSRQLVCMTPEGKIKWRSGRGHRFGLGPFLIADSKIFILDDHGVLTIARAESGQYFQLSQTPVLSGRESWAPIALAGTKMFLRDFEKMICLDLKP